MQIVFLCGGLGTRLRDINKDCPKGLLKINGIPFFEYIINSILPYEPSSFHFCLGYKSEQYLEFLKKLNTKTKITFSCEENNNLLGTGGAIKNALRFLNDDFIVQYGDTILDFNYKKFFDFHLKQDKDMTMTILDKEKTDETPNLYCRKVDNIFNCVYKKVNPLKNSNYIDYGALAFKKCIFNELKKKKFDLSEIQTALSFNNKATFFEVEKNYIEIGNIKSYKNAFNLLKK